VFQLRAFREQICSQFNRRQDALFDLLDALPAVPSTTAPAHMMLLPGFQRCWGSTYYTAGTSAPVAAPVILALLENMFYTLCRR
jgi:hypothetical protein